MTARTRQTLQTPLETPKSRSMRFLHIPHLAEVLIFNSAVFGGSTAKLTNVLIVSIIAKIEMVFFIVLVRYVATIFYL